MVLAIADPNVSFRWTNTHETPGGQPVCRYLGKITLVGAERVASASIRIGRARKTYPVGYAALEAESGHPVVYRKHEQQQRLTAQV
jgi:hypothetical protein